MKERQRKQISAYVQLSDSNVASGANPIGSAVTHPIEPTVQSFDGLEDSSRPQRTRRQLSIAKDSNTALGFKGLEEKFHCKGSSTVRITRTRRSFSVQKDSKYIG